jgi:hypothetical protein
MGFDLRDLEKREKGEKKAKQKKPDTICMGHQPTVDERPLLGRSSQTMWKYVAWWDP